MHLSEFSLAAVPPAERQKDVERILEDMRRELAARLPHGRGYVVGVRRPAVQSAGRAMGPWHVEVVCGTPFRRFRCSVVASDTDGACWHAELAFLEPFSGSILSWREAIGFVIGHALVIALVRPLQRLLGKSPLDEADLVRGALLQAISTFATDTVRHEL